MTHYDSTGKLVRLTKLFLIMNSPGEGHTTELRQNLKTQLNYLVYVDNFALSSIYYTPWDVKVYQWTSSNITAV